MSQRQNAVIDWTANPRHRCAKVAVLAPDGRSALDRIEAEQDPWADRFGVRIGRRELETASDDLARVVAEPTEPNGGRR